MASALSIFVRSIPVVGPIAIRGRRLLRRVLFNESGMRAAERYLRRYYTLDTQNKWGNGNPPEWFDHRADLYLWPELRRPLWVERGVFSREVMRPGCRVLDICCGDGFFPFAFYAGTAEHIDAVDRDETAIAHARKWHSLPNLTFHRADVVADPFPGTNYDVVCWDGAIEHFSAEQIRAILEKCAAVLSKPDGILCGYTMIERDDGPSHPDHQHEFTSSKQLEAVIRSVFPHVGTIETVYPERHNVYWRAAFSADRLTRFGR